MSRGKPQRPSRREELRARKAQRRANAPQDRRTGIIIILMSLPVLALGIGILWFVVVSMQQGYVDVEGPDVLYREDEPFAFHLENVLTAALGLFCAVMGLEFMLNGLREARGVRKAGAARTDAPRR